MKYIILACFVILTIVLLKAILPCDGDLLTGANRHVSLVEDKDSKAWKEVLIFKEEGDFPVVLRTMFQVEDPKLFTYLLLKKPLYIKNLTLNGKAIQKPMKGMSYKSIPGIPASLLKKGANELIATWTQKVRTHQGKKTSKVSIIPNQIDSAKLDISLFGLTASDLAFQTGPVLGYAGKNFFTVTCRINMPAEVVLHVDNRQLVSKPALLHSFKVKDLTANTQYQYYLKARLVSKSKFTASSGPYSMRTLSGGDKFTFAVSGDSRTHPKNWIKVARAVVRAQPAFSVFVGDMVSDGRHDYQWDKQYFGVAREYFATIPYYAVIGNHEQDCPLFTRIFQTPGGKNWSQQIGSVLLIGIDGSMDWNKGHKLAKWLEGLLVKSKAKFIFLFSHYPAWSSGGHGRLKNGHPVEDTIRLAQDIIMALLKKYDATAMFAGHDHFYERSEPKEGVSMVVTGGAGAPLRNKVKNAKKQNPYSKVFACKFHYCLMKIDGNICTLKVLTPEGELIDSRTWNARENK